MNKGWSWCEEEEAPEATQAETKSSMHKIKKVEVFISDYPTIETVVPLWEEEIPEPVNHSWDELIAKWK